MSKSASARKLSLDQNKVPLSRSKSASAAQKKKSAWTEEAKKAEEPKYRLSDASMEKLKSFQSELDELNSLQQFEKAEEKNFIQEDFASSDGDEPKLYNHVQFASQIEVNDGFETDPDTIYSNEELEKFSTPNSRGFAEFKAQLMASTTTASDENTTLKDATLRNDVSDMNDHLKARLLDLEKQIKMFQQEHAVLIKMKQQHELERMKLDQEREELEEKLNDERVKMEVYFHDERMKIKEKHENLDRRIKEIQKPSRKERDEVMKLNEKINHQEAELKAKEVKHSLAQARLRTQIRQLEKQNTEQKLEIEVLKRENKRLDTENVRLRRENNGKMLNEINKNIAKLANPAEPPVAATKKEVMNRSKSAVVAKVVSHAPKRRSKTPEIRTTKESDVDSDVENDNFIENRSTYFGQDKKKSDHQTASNGNSTMNLDRKETLNPDGSKDVWYSNGNIKKISADGMVIKMLYFNKDIKETNINEGTVKYYYSENNTWQTTFSDGKQVLEFPK